ncbi:helix-turn-helix domain-containing protein [Novosphingobium sp. FSY-8]|uniref:Helix-turn-helix domain-containing protein n=1 Tax=Novosphingobium ovatum TaxID=1908523 RepID=A0ABW9XCG8_9SPHN|nr:helix-turn-helix domain-containing protein [Novosphingobium ovatum]NBC36246.1 helix-turn-helix domain-containing protein [Novosphingobium ovatum]
MNKIAVSVSEAAAMLSLGRSSIYELMDACELEKIKFGRRTLITVESINNAVAKRLVNGRAAA